MMTTKTTMTMNMSQPLTFIHPVESKKLFRRKMKDKLLNFFSTMKISPLCSSSSFSSSFFHVLVLFVIVSVTTCPSVSSLESPSSYLVPPPDTSNDHHHHQQHHFLSRPPASYLPLLDRIRQRNQREQQLPPVVIAAAVAPNAPVNRYHHETTAPKKEGPHHHLHNHNRNNNHLDDNPVEDILTPRAKDTLESHPSHHHYDHQPHVHQPTHYKVLPSPHHDNPHHRHHHHHHSHHHHEEHHVSEESSSPTVHGDLLTPKSTIYHSQDIHGNYRFGYETHTLKGDGNCRYEKKAGGHTSGGYGYKTDEGRIESHKQYFEHEHPSSPYHPHHNYHHHNHPLLSNHNIVVPLAPAPPPPPPQPLPPSSPLEHDLYPVDLPPVSDNRLHVAADEAKKALLYGPSYDSLYDIDVPKVMYAHVHDEEDDDDGSGIISNYVVNRDPRLEESAPIPLEESESSTRSSSSNDRHRSNHENEVGELKSLYSSPFLSRYVDTFDTLTPIGFQSRINQVYRDRRKKKK